MNDQEVIDNLEMLKDLDLFEQEDADLIQNLDQVTEVAETNEPTEQEKAK